MWEVTCSFKRWGTKLHGVKNKTASPQRSRQLAQSKLASWWTTETTSLAPHIPNYLPYSLPNVILPSPSRSSPSFFHIFLLPSCDLHVYTIILLFDFIIWTTETLLCKSQPVHSTLYCLFPPCLFCPHTGRHLSTAGLPHRQLASTRILRESYSAYGQDKIRIPYFPKHFLLKFL